MWRFSFLLVSSISAFAASASAQPNLTLTTSLASGQKVGTSVTWTATLTNGGANPLFQFSVQDPKGNWKIIQDYSPFNIFTWTTLDEGAYTIAARAFFKSTTIIQSGTFTFSSRVVGSNPVVSHTSHPLVALYSAPPCTGSVQVYYYAVGKTSLLSTPAKPCQPGKSVNFYVGGMYANTTYYLQHVVTGPQTIHGPVMTFRTGSPAITLPVVTPNGSAGSNTSVGDGILLFGSFSDSLPQVPAVATDLAGAVLWYQPINSGQPSPVLQRPVDGGTMLYLGSYLAPGLGVLPGQFLLEYDMVGNLVRETGVWGINLQLAALGRNPVSWLSHEGLRLTNGHTLLFGSEERIFTDVQGPGPVDVVGDLIIDLDPNYSIAWLWSAFDHLDVTRKATLNETCTFNNGCGPLYRATQANDWTHGNSIAYVPADGSLIVSLRNQDWVIKVDYVNGTGTGDVLWRLGADGDFTLNTSSPDLWFSHQHDAEFDGTNLDLFDNSDVRYVESAGKATSRGQVWLLDEVNRIATPAVNYDMGTFYAVVGASAKLKNGNYFFASSNIFLNGAPRTDAVEVSPAGAQVLPSFTFNAYTYRVFRMTSLYFYVPGL